MSNAQQTSDSNLRECKALMDACTPLVYQNNAFRITGLATDATVRDVKRRIDDLKHAEEMGDTVDEHSHAFALDSPPTLQHIREAALKLHDPERRIVEEFFWFWPMKWGNGKHDSALRALANGDWNAPYKTWGHALSDEHSEIRSVSKHNLAIMYHMSALDGELLGFERSLSTESIARKEKYWRASLHLWEQLSDDEIFWSLISDRIRVLDDPRLTTGFARRMRAALPEALDKINAMLAMQCIERGEHELAQKHIVYMKESHQGLDNVPKTLAMITAPLQVRIRNAVEKAMEVANREPENAAEAAEELFKTVEQPIENIKAILPPTAHDRIDLCDAVAEAGMECSNAFVKKERDLRRCLAILHNAQRLAESAEVRQRIAEILSIATDASSLEPILRQCEQALELAQENPENALQAAQSLLWRAKNEHAINVEEEDLRFTVHRMPLLVSIDESAASLDAKNRARDEIASAATQCAIAFGNRTEKWKPCTELLEACLAMAVDPELKSYIEKNLHTAQNNVIQELRELSGLLQHPHRPSVWKAIGDKAKEIFSALISVAVICSLIAACGFLVDSCKSKPVQKSQTTHLSPSKPTTQSQTKSKSIEPSLPNTLASEIASGKIRANQMEAKIQEMDNLLEDYKRKMDSYRTSGMTDAYNSLVAPANSLIGERNNLYEEYERLVDSINVMVTRYNSGSR